MMSYGHCLCAPHQGPGGVCPSPVPQFGAPNRTLAAKGVPSERESGNEISDRESVGWGTWIRTRTNGVRVRGSTVNLFPNGQPSVAAA